MSTIDMMIVVGGLGLVTAQAWSKRHRPVVSAYQPPAKPARSVLWSIVGVVALLYGIAYVAGCGFSAGFR